MYLVNPYQGTKEAWSVCMTHGLCFNFFIKCLLPTVYVFYDCLKNDAENYPRELTQMYTISKKLGEGSYGEVRLAYRQV